MSKDEVNGQDDGNDYEDDHSAGFGPASDLVHEDESYENEYPTKQLHYGMAAVKVK
jgi:hypothetical protein